MKKYFFISVVIISITIITLVIFMGHWDNEKQIPSICWWNGGLVLLAIIASIVAPRCLVADED